MSSFLLTFFLLNPLILIPNNGNNSLEPFKLYIKKNVNQIKDLDFSDTAFSDFATIGNAINEIPIVMIGEQDHGDGMAISAKAKMVAYLHKKKGFSVLIFESDLYGLNYRNLDSDDLNNNNITLVLNDNIYPVWTSCLQFQPVIQYIVNSQSTRNPLNISGFDMEFNGPKSLFLEGFKKTMVSNEINLPPNLLKIVDTIINNTRTGLSLSKNSLDKLLKFNFSAYNKIAVKGKYNFWLLLLNNLSSKAKEIFLRPRNIDSALAIREDQMANNLLWLIRNKYKHQKVIIWSANSHVAKETSKNFERHFGIYQSMTERISKFINKDSIYAIGMSSKRGEYRRFFGKTQMIDKIQANSFENWISDSIQYAFIDFRKFRNNTKKVTPMFVMSNPDHANVSARWTNIYDGIFYIRDMLPCQEIK